MENYDEPLSHKLSDFYDIAKRQWSLDERELSPSLHEISLAKPPYTEHELIAQGGMKQVFKVFDSRCRRYVAMATLHDDAPAELSDSLIHEAWLTAMLDHPNIIDIHEVGVDSNDRPYFTMDLKIGDSLSQLISKLREKNPEAITHYPFDRLLQIFIKICDAIAYAHSIQVLHHDLKPANIQVGRFGEVVVCDWGLGRVVHSHGGIEFERLLLNSTLLSSNTLFGEVRGTPGYMAPEQLKTNGTRDARTDIYQLGCILYTLLTLQPPASGETSEMLRQLENGLITPPRERAPERNIPLRLEAVVAKAMAADPQHRYCNVEELQQEVNLYLAGFATRAENAGLVTQLYLLYQRNKQFFNTLFCGLLLAIFGAAWSYWKLVEKERIATTAQSVAERTLALYQAGQDETEMLSIKNAHSVERAVVEMHLNASRYAPEDLLTAALESDADNPVFLRALGEHHFILQHFNQAIPLLDRGEKRETFPDQLICDLAHEYAKLKPDDSRPLTTSQLVNLLRSIDGFDGFEAMIVLNDEEIRLNPGDRAAIVEEHLRSINPDWRDGWFEYDFKESRLRLGGKGLQRLSSSGDILGLLKPSHLDLSGSEVSNLWQQVHHAIRTLDLRGCQIDGPGVVHQFAHLQLLITSPDQIELRNAVRAGVTVVIKELE